MFRSPGTIDNTRQTYEVDGIRASLNEYNVWQALVLEDIAYIFQFKLFSAGGAAGEIKVDFVIFPDGFGRPLEVQGAFWHSNNDERFRMALIEDYFNQPIIIIEEDESMTIVDARRAVRGEVY